MPIRYGVSILAILLLAMMFLLAGGAALRESVAVDEVAHIGAGVSYLQTLDMRFNEEHPPLAKVLAALPLVARGTHADYSGTIWNASRQFFPAYLGEWIFGEYVLTHWNNPQSTLPWARLPMMLLTIALGWLVFALARGTEDKKHRGAGIDGHAKQPLDSVGINRREVRRSLMPRARRRVVERSE